MTTSSQSRIVIPPHALPSILPSVAGTNRRSTSFLFALNIQHMRRLKSPVRLFLFLALCVTQNIFAGDWRQFRGPTSDGHAQCAIPTNWSETENIKWKVPVKGKGHSSPVIADGQVWLTTAIARSLTDEEKEQKLEGNPNARMLDLAGSVSLHALCFDFYSGKLLYDVKLFDAESPEPIHFTNTYASPTPVLSEGKLLASFGTYGTAAIDTASGEVLWRNEKLHATHSNGPGSSPVLFENLLIIHFDGTDQQYIAAINVQDGSVAWRTERTGEMQQNPEFQKAYATPFLTKGANGPELISPAADWVYGYNPQNGSELWKAKYGGLGFSTVPCPVVGHGMTYICTSFMKSRLLAIKLGGRGDITDQIAWSVDKQIPQKPSILLIENELFCATDKGILTCLDALTGEEIWRARLGGNFAASPIYSEGKIYCFDQAGKTTVVAAAREYKTLAINELDSGCSASAAAVDGKLFVRTNDHLYCIAE